MKIKWSRNLGSSSKRRKQRKYLFNSPLHIKRKLLGAPLSKELKAKYNKNSTTLRKGDKVTIMRGSFKGKTGKIDIVNIRKTRVSITGIDFTKKDGAKKMIAVHPSKLMITELALEDKRRDEALIRNKK